MTPARDAAILRLREATGPGGYRREDIDAACDAAEKLEQLRALVRATVRYLQASGPSITHAAAIDLLEDALGEVVDR